MIKKTAKNPKKIRINNHEQPTGNDEFSADGGGTNQSRRARF